MQTIRITAHTHTHLQRTSVKLFAFDREIEGSCLYVTHRTDSVCGISIFPLFIYNTDELYLLELQRFDPFCYAAIFGSTCTFRFIIFITSKIIPKLLGRGATLAQSQQENWFLVSSFLFCHPFMQQTKCFEYRRRFLLFTWLFRCSHSNEVASL